MDHYFVNHNTTHYSTSEYYEYGHNDDNGEEEERPSRKSKSASRHELPPNSILKPRKESSSSRTTTRRTTCTTYPQQELNPTTNNNSSSIHSSCRRSQKNSSKFKKNASRPNCGMFPFLQSFQKKDNRQSNNYTTYVNHGHPSHHTFNIPSLNNFDLDVVHPSHPPYLGISFWEEQNNYEEHNYQHDDCDYDNNTNNNNNNSHSYEQDVVIEQEEMSLEHLDISNIAHHEGDYYYCDDEHDNYHTSKHQLPLSPILQTTNNSAITNSFEQQNVLHSTTNTNHNNTNTTPNRNTTIQSKPKINLNNMTPSPPPPPHHHHYHHAKHTNDTTSNSNNHLNKTEYYSNYKPKQHYDQDQLALLALPTTLLSTSNHDNHHQQQNKGHDCHSHNSYHTPYKNDKRNNHNNNNSNNNIDQDDRNSYSTPTLVYRSHHDLHPFDNHVGEEEHNGHHESIHSRRRSKRRQHPQSRNFHPYFEDASTLYDSMIASNTSPRRINHRTTTSSTIDHHQSRKQGVSSLSSPMSFVDDPKKIATTTFPTSTTMNNSSSHSHVMVTFTPKRLFGDDDDDKVDDNHHDKDEKLHTGGNAMCRRLYNDTPGGCGNNTSAHHGVTTTGNSNDDVNTSTKVEFHGSNNNDCHPYHKYTNNNVSDKNNVIIQEEEDGGVELMHSFDTKIENIHDISDEISKNNDDDNDTNGKSCGSSCSDILNPATLFLSTPKPQQKSVHDDEDDGTIPTPQRMLFACSPSDDMSSIIVKNGVLTKSPRSIYSRSPSSSTTHHTKSPTFPTHSSTRANNHQQHQYEPFSSSSSPCLSMTTHKSSKSCMSVQTCDVPDGGTRKHKQSGMLHKHVNTLPSFQPGVPIRLKVTESYAGFSSEYVNTNIQNQKHPQNSLSSATADSANTLHNEEDHAFSDVGASAMMNTSNISMLSDIEQTNFFSYDPYFSLGQYEISTIQNLEYGNGLSVKMGEQYMTLQDKDGRVYGVTRSRHTFIPSSVIYSSKARFVGQIPSSHRANIDMNGHDDPYRYHHRDECNDGDDDGGVELYPWILAKKSGRRMDHDVGLHFVVQPKDRKNGVEMVGGLFHKIPSYVSRHGFDSNGGHSHTVVYRIEERLEALDKNDNNDDGDEKKMKKKDVASDADVAGGIPTGKVEESRGVNKSRNVTRSKRTVREEIPCCLMLRDPIYRDVFDVTIAPGIDPLMIVCTMAVHFKMVSLSCWKKI